MENKIKIATAQKLIASLEQQGIKDAKEQRAICSAAYKILTEKIKAIKK